MKEGREDYVDARDRVQWLPAFVFLTSGDKNEDDLTKHDILVECNFVEPEADCLARLRESGAGIRPVPETDGT